MSRLKRLTIRGVRNFSSETESAEIKFTRPMTLILGPNGTGKTTIIEALKYSTSGDFPPGSDGGKYFVHDPKLTNATTVRGQVKLEIIDKKGQSVTVCRTLECVQQPKSVKMKSLDATVTTINPDTKQKIMINGRCADIAQTMVTHMGVSKPILNYVLFCHQEELNWPFEDGKKLKEKFDEIFGTTKFNKALDNVRGLIKSRTALTKTIKAEKEKFAVLKNEVTEREKNLEKLLERKEESIARSEKIKEDLKPLREKIQALDEKENEYRTTTINEDKKKMEYNLAKKDVNNLKSSIHKIYEGTTEQLKLELQENESFLSKKNADIREFELKLQAEARKEEKLAKDIAEYRVQIGTLKQKMKDHNDRIANRNRMLENALATLDVKVSLSNISDNEIDDYLRTLKEKFEDLERDAEDTRQQKEIEEKRLQQQIDVLRSDKSKVESETNVREKELSEIRKEITTVQSEITQAGVAGKRLNEIEMKLREVNNRCEALGKKMDVNATKVKINEEIKKRNEIENEIQKLDEEISLMHQHSSLQAELDLQKSAREAKEKNLESIKEKHASNLKILLDVDEIPMKKLRKSLDEVHQRLLTKKETLTKQLETEQHRTTSLQTMIRHNVDELKQKEDELKSDKAKVSVHCDYNNYDDVVMEQLKRVKSLQDDRGMYAYQGAAYKKYLEKVQAKDPCCPVCNRGFQNDQEAKNLSQKMKRDIESVPGALRECESKLKIEQKKYDSLLQLKSTVEKILKFEGTELKKAKEAIEIKRKQFKEAEEKKVEIRSQLKDPEEKLIIWKNTSGDIVLWDQCFDDIEKLDRQIAAIKRRVSNAGVNFDKTMEEAQQERDTLKNSIRECREQIESMQAALNSHCDKLEKAKEQRLGFQEEKLRLSSNLQKLQQFHDKAQELSTKKEVLVKTIQELRQKLVSAEDELETAIQNMDKAKTENHESLKSDRERIDRVSKRLYELNKIQSEIEKFIENGTEEKLQRVEEKVKNFDDMISTLKNSKSTLEKKISSIREDMTQQELSKRTLMDNLTLRTKEKDLDCLKKQWEQFQECVKNFQIERVRAERRQLREEEESLMNQRSKIEGTQEELRQNIKQLEAELRRSEYKNARQNFKYKAIELVATQEAVENLKTYSRILDASMIEYHEERMNTVNKIMDRMWNVVYTGNDTSTIQIRTNATEGTDTARRTYNYKLIQKKNGVEMDMKGRCSAGQRVLTSIIIRMALAETFCGECGVMALDEPTTNLDESNSKSLADALCTIVNLRSQQQKSFQLIVISHDEPFITRLSQANSHKGYYQLTRGPDGRSLIDYRNMTGAAVAKPVATLDESSGDEDDYYDGVATVNV
ncbi:DNA repair protein RAD50 [Belonocnema kinseyi]|uniref:DNA repair protein RAD50 n=1 Tax=Belonocnema kinseyi TaxID=2817044 RepID=UPI00143D3AC1|nr:DNA repair protein RAD50 [Belonocnema kinseyi]